MNFGLFVVPLPLKSGLRCCSRVVSLDKQFGVGELQHQIDGVALVFYYLKEDRV